MRLAAKSLDFAYDKKGVLSNVELAIAPGRMVCLAGPNGSGKSTLLRCLDRILRPKNGSVLIDNQDMGKLSMRELARRIAYVPQSSSQNLGSTVFDTVLMGRKPYMHFCVGDEDRNAVAGVLAMMNLEEMALRYFDELSGGERQKVLIARALAQETDIVLLDEPTSNLDLCYQLEVAELLTRLKTEKGLSLVMAIHDLNLASRYADHLILLHQGSVFAQGRPLQVLTRENIREVYGVDAVVEPAEDGRPFIRPLRTAPAPDAPHKAAKSRSHEAAE